MVDLNLNPKNRNILLKALKVFGLVVVFHCFMYFANQALNHTDAIIPDTVLFRAGDDPSWRHKTINLEGWETKLPEEVGVWWLRAEFDLDKHEYPDRSKEIVITHLGSYEAYFDGFLIGVNGKVSNEISKEIPGDLDMKFALPDSLSHGGKRILALRISNQNSTTNSRPQSLEIDSYNEFFKRGIIKSMLLYTLAGIFLIVSIYYFFLSFLSHRKKGYLEFGFFCLVIFLLIIETYSRYYFPYKYTQYEAWLFWSGILSLLAALILPVFLINNFQLSRPPFVIGVSSVLILLSYFVFHNDEIVTLVISALISLIITVYAICKRRFGSEEALVGLIVFLTGMIYFNISILELL